MTQTIFERMGINLPDLYAQENVENPIAYAHFSHPSGWHWYVTEGRLEDDGDMLLFGLVNSYEKEIGYFTLKELASVGAGLDIEFEPVGIFDIYEDFDLRR